MPVPPRMPPGSTVRYQVQHPELGCGSSWSARTHPSTGDVYVAHREAGRWIKSSFHESGQWHYGLGAAAIGEDETVKRYLCVTHEHREVSPGWVHAHQVAVPRSELRHYDESVRNRSVIPVVIPWGYDALALNLYIGEPGYQIALRLDPHTRVIADLERGDGGRALIFKQPMTLERPVAQIFASEIAEARGGIVANGWDGRPTRIAIFGMADPLGPHNEVEVAIDGVP